MSFNLKIVGICCAFAALPCAPSAGQDTSLSEYLIEGEEWRVAVEGFAFADGLCTDAEGNLFFSDVKEGKGIYRLDARSGKVDLHIDDLPGISGLALGIDGTIYACQSRSQRVISIPPGGGEVKVLAENVRCNDLVVTRGGAVYFTETPTQRIHLVTAAGEHRVVHEGGINRPNGIALSPDEQTLAASDSGGEHVWAWRVLADGSLEAVAPFMMMELALGKETSQGDGMTTEGKGRFFVTTELGIQIFDPAGRLAGIIDKPERDGKIVSVEFAGPDRCVLHVASGGRIYSRKVKTPGGWRF